MALLLASSGLIAAQSFRPSMPATQNYRPGFYGTHRALPPNAFANGRSPRYLRTCPPNYPANPSGNVGLPYAYAPYAGVGCNSYLVGNSGAYSGVAYGYGGYWPAGYVQDPLPSPPPELRSGSDEPVIQLSNEVGALKEEIEQLRASRQATPAPASAPSTPQELPVTLVLRSGKQLLVRDYAMTDSVIYIMDGHNPQRVPLADLDLATTQKVNEQNGVTFVVPLNR